MGTILDNITKKEKFKKVMSIVRDVIYFSEYYKDYDTSLLPLLSTEERMLLLTTETIEMNGLPKKHNRHPNNPAYDDYIDLALALIQKVVDNYIPLEKQVNEKGVPFCLKTLTSFLADDEVEDWKKASPFTCMLREDVHVKKIHLETSEDGDEYKNPIASKAGFEFETLDLKVTQMGGGLYEIVETGERFDMIECIFGTASCVLPLEDSENHTLLTFCKGAELLHVSHITFE